MTKMLTIYKGNLRNEVTHLQSGTKILTDAPLDNHGKGESFSPTDLLASSLGCCMLTIMGISAQSYGFSLEGTRVETEKIMGTDPRRVVEIKIDFHFPEGSNFTPQQKRIIESAAKTCPVANSLHPDLKKTINFNW
ncbi:MAG: OsmC family protein [Bacteroidales bacterium]|nr:OsmC family protein [Bacteroidales bacterium]MBQ1882645.1 OsmC family protein [Bacteroidales bacterium]MBQ2482985.1 OsmC family protein [Bacteroidales bacterium]MBQ2492225.1 OsmC family protein [Bacteroidales bacterium]MBQ4196978.1 OsmC family protein [Bacteroidales bacterium]